MHISFKTEFGASFPHCHIPLEGKRGKAHTILKCGSAEPCTSAVPQRKWREEGRWWAHVLGLESCSPRWGLRAEAGILAYIVWEMTVFFQLVILFSCETWGLCVGLDVTNFSQVKGIAGGTFDHQMELIWNQESTKEHWTVTEGACCAQDRQFSPLL